MKGFVYRERKFWTPSARDQGSELPSSSETELVLKHPRHLANYLACSRNSEVFAKLKYFLLPSKQ